ncbi:cytochrome b/b6 domain-containing protein [Alteromonas sp. CYL-A6]|uniref:cytochrome b/b6 domain-containing protein n=1 Tax=Alteromonas nitratireducens TaxID=3390813 RepID=UPI0034BF804D
MPQTRIWDIPTRLFHWLLVACIVAQYVTAEWLDDAMQLHFQIGYFTLGLIIFRVLWGIVGTHYARFSSFVRSPAAVIGYAKTLTDKNSPAYAGHNPLGGYAVLLLLLMVALQAVSGLFMTDDVFLDGPYRHLVSDTTLEVMNWLHHNVFNLLIAVIALHVVAIGYYARYKQQPLVPAMLHGKKPVSSPGIPSSRLLLAIVVALITAGLVYYALFVAPPAPAADELFY